MSLPKYIINMDELTAALSRRDITVNDAADSLKQAIVKTGHRAEIVLPIFGKIKLNENDIDKLREYINNA